MTAFQPHGSQARWRTIYDHLRLLTVDDVLTYDALAEMLALDAEDDRHAIQMAMRRAAQQFEREDKHAVEPVPTVGYRVVAVPEHLVLAQRQQTKAGRALRRGHSKVVNVDLSQVEPEVRGAFQVVAQAFSAQMEMNRRLDLRQKRVEKSVAEVTEQQARSDAEVQELRERLERLERGAGE